MAEGRMKVVFIKKKLPQRVVRDIRKATNADIVTTAKTVCTPELCRNKYGRYVPKPSEDE